MKKELMFVFLIFGIIYISGLAMAVPENLRFGKNMYLSVGQNSVNEYSVPIQKGWNLVWGFGNPEWISGGDINENNIKAVYGFDSKSKEYFQLYPYSDLDIDSLGVDKNYLVYFTAFWVYSDKQGTMKYWNFQQVDFKDNLVLFKGWNFVGITSEMYDKKLNDIKGTCNIEKSYFWNPEDKKWENDFGISQGISRDAIGLGSIIKVSDDCKLGTTFDNIPTVPTTP